MKARSRVMARLQAMKRVKKQITTYAPKPPTGNDKSAEKIENPEKTSYKSSQGDKYIRKKVQKTLDREICGLDL